MVTGRGDAAPTQQNGSGRHRILERLERTVGASSDNGAAPGWWGRRADSITSCRWRPHGRVYGSADDPDKAPKMVL